MDVPIEVQIGQMIMVGFRGTTIGPDDAIVAALRAGQVGAVWLCDFVSPQGEMLGNIESPGQLRRLISELKRVAPGPLLVALDAEGGNVIRLREEYGFAATRSAAELGALDDVGQTTAAARGIAETLAGLGVNLNLAPVVDLNRAPENPSLGGKGRCYGAGVDVVARHAEAVVRAHQEAGLACALKHFPGQGSALKDAHLGIADVTETWRREELAPFAALIQGGLADAVLTAHVMQRTLDPLFPASLSRRITTELLRGELGFDGLVICDDLGMGAIRDNFAFEEAVFRAVEAGADIVLHANTGLYQADIAQRTFAAIERCVAEGRLAAARIRESYERVQALKRRLAGSGGLRAG